MIREQNAKHLPRQARAAIIIEEGDTRMVYVLRPPIVLHTDHEYEHDFFDPIQRPHLVSTTMTVEGELVEGRIWTGDMPTAEPQQQALAERREEIER